MKKSELRNIIKEEIQKILIEMPTLYDPHSSTIKKRMYNNTLHGELDEPSKREIDHEVMRIKTLLIPRPQQYKMRLTKITNPTKMYTALLALLQWKRENPEDSKVIMQMIDIARNYLKYQGYSKYLPTQGQKKLININ